MSFQIDKKMVVGISSNALFDLKKEDDIFIKEGLDAYKQYQVDHKSKILPKGVAFPFIKRLLSINLLYIKEQPIEVVLLSNNSPEIGIRIFNSINYYGLNITRAAFTSGNSIYQYLPAFNLSLFLSTNEGDVNHAISKGYPAGRVIRTEIEDDDDPELRIAFDFDGVIIDDEAEKIYQKEGIEQYCRNEIAHVSEPHHPGPLADFFRKIAYFQKMETKKQNRDGRYRKILNIAIITARGAPTHERALNTLKSWGVNVDQMFLLGGIEKKRILEVLKPHIYFDDQKLHLDDSMKNVPLIHIPFGISNKKG